MNPQISDFVKICPLGDELFSADGQTDTDMTKLFRVCGSVHLQIFNKNNQPDAQSILYLLLCRVDTAQHVSGTVVLVNRPQLEARPTRQSYGNQRLQDQLKGAPDDGHNGARNMLIGVYATKE
jgi:hypothetical protein